MLKRKFPQLFFNLIFAASLLLSGSTTVLAQSQTQSDDGRVLPPMYSSLAWDELGTVSKDVHVFGDVVTLNGDAFKAVVEKQDGGFDDVVEYYSSENLQSLGWTFTGGAGLALSYQHDMGWYLIVEIEECTDRQENYCVNVWFSTETSDLLRDEAAVINAVAFSKIAPANGATIAPPATTYQLLQWGDAEKAASDRYQYCIDETNNQQCDDDIWVTRNSLYSGGPGDFQVLPGRTYYWQVRVRDANIYANGGTWWSFRVVANYPSVTSIVRAIPTTSLTNASAVSFTVTFDRDVTGVDIGDFALHTTGVSGANVAAVGGSGKNYTVLVNTGTGSGAIRLDLVDNDTIKDAQNNPLGGTGAGNGNFSTGEVFTLDRTPPTVLSSVPSLTAVPGVITFTVTFSENVTGVNAADFELTTTGAVNGAQISTVAGTSPGSVYVVTVTTGGVGAGTIRLDVLDNDSIVDVLLNPLGGVGLGNGDFIAGTVFAKPTFADVPITSSGWAEIEAVYLAGITGGCGGGNYCPGASVTRAQMAIFLLRGIYGQDYTPPAATGTEFLDVPITHSAAAWIEQLAAEGITGGCGNGNYCPSSPVTRAQMAIFLLRAKYGDDYVPPAATGTEFLDVPIGHSAAAWIEQLAAEGITGGCGGGNYCPNNSVTRAQMAIFLQKTFNLPLP
jgi:hypothetical protein